MRKESFETPGAVRIKVDNRAGSVQLLTGDSQVTEVEIYSERDNQELESATTIAASPFPGGTEVQVSVPQSRRILGLRDSDSVVVSIRAPHGADLDIKTASADVEATGNYGRAGIETVSGDIAVDESRQAELRSVSGDVAIGSSESGMHLKSVSGDVTAGRSGGATEVSTTSGDVKLGQVDGDVSVDTVSGDLRVDRVASGASLRSVSGDVRVNWTDGDVRARTVSGDVVIGVGPGHGVRIEAQSKSGEVVSEIGLSDGPRSPLPDDGGRAEGSDIELSVQTLSGDVRLVPAQNIA